MHAIREHSILTGAGIGLVWGIAMRAWMRFISTEPEFSWEGTLFILGAATIVGALLGLARHRRRQGGIGWWRLSALSLALLGVGGAVMWPAVVAGAAALGLRRPTWLRLTLAAAAVVSQIPVVRSIAIDNQLFGPIETVIAIVWYLPMLTIEAWGFSVVATPRAEGAPAPGRIKRVVITTPLVLVTVFGVIAVGAS